MVAKLLSFLVLLALPSNRFHLHFVSTQVDRDTMKERILSRVVTYPETFSESAKSLCDALMVKEVEKRMGFKDNNCDELRAHPFFCEINWRKLNEGTELEIDFLRTQKCLSMSQGP